MKLEDIFYSVLQGAIQAQYKANEYSAQLAKEKMFLHAGGTIDLPVQDNSYYPIPNSSFQNINVNLKLKLEDIESDLLLSFGNVISRAHAELGKQFIELGDVLANTDPVELASELSRANMQHADEDIVRFAARFFSLYVYYFERYFHDIGSSSVATSKSRAIEEAKRVVIQQEQSGDERYLEIDKAVMRAIAGIQPYKNIRFRADDNETDPDRLCEIALNLNMRTFSWANYGTSI